MKKILLSVLLLTSTICIAQPSTTTFYRDQNGMPVGSATQSGTTTFYRDQNGMPTGTATQSGDTTFIHDQNGAPVGSSTTTPKRPLLPFQPTQYYPFPSK